MAISKKQKLLSLLAPLSISLITLGGGSVSIWYSVENYTLSSEFGKTNQYKISLDETAITDDSSLSKTAKNFSEYLKYSKIETYETVVGEMINNKPYLNFSLPVQRDYYPNHSKQKTDEKKHDIPGITTLFENINSNNIDFIVDLDTSKTVLPTNGTEASGIIFNSKNLVDSDSKISSLKSNDKAVVITSMTSNSGVGDYITASDWKNFYDKFWAEPSGDATISTTPQIYIVRDKESLLSRMHFILDTYLISKKFGENKDKIDSNYSYTNANKFLSSDEWEWAETITKDVDINLPMDFLKGSIFGDSGAAYKPYASSVTDFFSGVSTAPIYSTTIPTNAVNGFKNGDTWYSDGYSSDAAFYRLIDADRTTSLYPGNNASLPIGSANSGDKSFGKDWGYEWMRPYILGIISKSNFISYFPKKDPFKNDAQEDYGNIGKWLVLADNGGSNEIQTPNKYLSNLIKRSLYTSNNNDKLSNPIPFNVIRETSDWTWQGDPDVFGTNTGTLFQSLADGDSITYKSRTLKNGWIISSPIIGMIVGLILVILSIGIIVSLLYRIPGVMFTCSLFGAVTFTLLFLTLAGKLMSLSILLAIIIGVVMSVMSLFSLMQKMKKHTFKNDFILNSAKKGATKGIWEVVDFHVILVIVGACFLYFGTLANNEFGLTLMLYSLMSMFFIVLWGVSSILLFRNKVNEKSAKLIFNEKKILELDFKRNDDNIKETSFITFNKWNKFNLFGLWKEVISACVIIVFMLLGITLLVVFKNSTWLYKGKTGTSDFVNLVYTTLIVGGFASLYALIRINWTSVLSVFVSAIFAPTLLFSIMAVFHMPINEQINNVYPMFLAINTLLTFSLIANVNNKWIKNRFHQFKELRDAINNEIKTSTVQYYSYIGIIFAIVFVSLFCFSSISLLYPVIFLLIGTAVSCLILLTVSKSVLFLFIILRYKYKVKVTQNNIFFIKNYDKVDEQHIDGINKFAYNKITL